MKKNELSLLDVQMEKTAIISDNLVNALSIRSAHHIETKVDSDGKEYLSATFALKAPTKNRSEIVVNDMSMATKIERLYNFEALGEVSSIASCREMANMADTDATALGFDSISDMLQSIFGKGKSTLSNYRRIGEYFVNDDYTLRGAIPQDTTVSLLNQLLSFVVRENDKGEADISNVEALFKYGIITPYMKQADYKKILNAIAKLETSKELKDMTEEEVEDFKKELKESMKPSKQEKSEEKKSEEKKSEEKKSEEKSEELTTEQEIIGASMSKIKELEESFSKLQLSEEETRNVANWLDMLYITLSEKLG